MTIAAGKKPSAADLVLPAVVTGYGNGSNTITATSWTVLPTNTCTAAITNPHPTAAMRILCTYGGWLSASANDVRMMPAVSGSVTIAAGVGTSAAVSRRSRDCAAPALCAGRARAWAQACRAAAARGPRRD